MAAKLPREGSRRNAQDAEIRHQRALLEMVALSVAESEDGTEWGIRGDSMRPLLANGDLVRVVAMTDPPRRGDIILFRSAADELICHRVLHPGPPAELAGDHNQRLDRVISSDLLGRAVAVRRRNRCLRLDRGVHGLTAPSLGAWHRQTRRLLVASSGFDRAFGLLLELARLSFIHLLAAGWLFARQERAREVNAASDSGGGSESSEG